LEEMVMEPSTKGITMRELYRHAAAVLDELERTGRGVVISRYGRAVAYLGPLPDDYVPGSFDRIFVLPRTHAMASLVPEAVVDDEVPDEILEELDDRRRETLKVLRDSDEEWWGPIQTDDLPLVGGCVGLEMLGLAERKLGASRWKLTPKGLRAVAMLDAA
jgi:antitoxin (DNA-binding transcriptional repressor) of toxin-antitoxin stability system